MSKFRDLCSTFSKTKVKLGSSTFEIGYIQNFVKIRNLILFGQKCSNLGIWARNFRKQMPDTKETLSK